MYQCLRSTRGRGLPSLRDETDALNPARAFAFRVGDLDDLNQSFRDN